jgi:hypothetical protein
MVSSVDVAQFRDAITYGSATQRDRELFASKCIEEWKVVLSRPHFPRDKFELKAIRLSLSDRVRVFDKTQNLSSIRGLCKLEMREDEVYLDQRDGGNVKIFSHSRTLEVVFDCELFVRVLSIILHKCDDEICEHDKTPRILVFTNSSGKRHLPQTRLFKSDFEGGHPSHGALDSASLRSTSDIILPWLDRFVQKGPVALVEMMVFFPTERTWGYHCISVYPATLSYTKLSLDEIPAGEMEVDGVLRKYHLETLPELKTSNIENIVSCDATLFWNMEIKDDGWVSWSK